MAWDLADPDRYNAFLGPLLVRVDDGVARVRMTPEHKHSNLGDNVHGGALLGFMDVALFAAARAFGSLGAGRAVTLDLSSQFIAGGKVGEPLEARIELLRETGRMLFLRGLIVQDSIGTVASFSGTLRKSSGAAG
ncbi:PaaI family thioesterase [Sphingomonas aracearum]|uniref:PaaI family thioesterase n=1 Tax=Sphingomonas aracearum TaxID=2283317 RepID=A0A369W2H9_9SPHN|nr:PaaI family thioesterase [Sphingomonas aracearum]RDE07482.1 PaaI family thioesterase [Sphingomonas aracearum]